MRRSALLFVIFSAAALAAAAQKKLNYHPKPAEWPSRPIVHDVPPQFADEPAFVLQEDVTIDYRAEGGHTNMYRTHHRLLKVLDARGVSSFDDLAFTVSRDASMEVHGRIIRPDGKVDEIPDDDIKTTQDYEGRTVLILETNGIARYSEIELLVKETKPAVYFGCEYFQYDVPVVSAHFSLSCPRNMTFEAKGYKGFPGAHDTLVGNRRHIELTQASIPALRPGPLSFYDNYRMRAEYRIIHMIDANQNDKRRLFTWDDLGRQLYDEHYHFSGKELAAVNDYLSELGVHAGSNELDNLRKIESGIKTGIVLCSTMQNNDGGQLDNILAHRVATTEGCIRLYAACFTQARVQHQLGLGGDKRMHKLDEGFENWDNVDQYLFYFPHQKRFMAPLSPYLRYPMVPEELTSTKGVFCLIPPSGNITKSLAELLTITPLSIKQNTADMSATVTFTEDMDARVDFVNSYKGYPSTSLRTQLVNATKEQQTVVVYNALFMPIEIKDIVGYTVNNENYDNYCTGKPLEIAASVNAGALVEKMDKQYLFKVGVLAMPEERLMEKVRHLPIDIDYPVSYTHTITINIPKGYKVLNPEVLRVKAEYVDRKLAPMICFNSDYVLTSDKKLGDKLVVTVTENYPVLHFASTEYERFKDVVNTASDFGKTMLILSKDNRKTPKAKSKVVVSLNPNADVSKF